MSDETCAICGGHRWVVIKVIDDYGTRPEVRACGVCNPLGEAGIGYIVDARTKEEVLPSDDMCGCGHTRGQHNDVGGATDLTVGGCCYCSCTRFVSLPLLREAK